MERAEPGAKTFLIALALALWLVGFASAADTPTQIADALRKHHVYIAAGADGTTNDTAGVIEELLRPTDGIVVALLPEGSGVPGSIADAINQRLGGKRIVAVAVGKDVAGYSTILPSGVASDLMKRAATVSVSTPETIETFILNVHDWQTQHPKAPAAKPVKEESNNHSVFLIFALALGGSLVILWGARLLTRAPAEAGSVKLKKSPDRVKDQLHKMLELREKIRDSSLQETLTQIASDVEAYFRRTKDAARLDQDAFAKHLTSLNSVLAKYVDVQDNPRYFENPEELLRSGAEAATSFAYFVLETVRREGRRSITDFRVDTDILSAQRYR